MRRSDDLKNKYRMFGVEFVTLMISISAVFELSTSALYGVGLIVFGSIIYLPSMILLPILAKKLATRFCIFIIILLGTLLYIPAFMTVKLIIPDVYNIFGIYLPIVSLNTYFFKFFFFRKSLSIEAHYKNIATSFGSLFIFIFVISCFREILGRGTLFGILVSNFTIPAVLLPFSAFIIAGLSVAGVNFLRIRRRRVKERRIIDGVGR